MNQLCKLAAIPVLISSSLAAAPFLSIGDNAELFVTAKAGFRYEDNIFLTDNNKEDDFSFIVAPGLELVFGKNSLWKGTLSAAHTWTEYFDTPDIDSDLTTVNFITSYDGVRWKINANASYREIYQNSRDTRNVGNPTNQLVRRNITAAGVNAEYLLTVKTKLGAGVQYHDTHYKTADYTDSTDYSVPLNYYYGITEKVDLSAGIRYRHTDVDSASSSDRDDYYFNVGARGEFTPKLSGRASIGYNLRTYDDSDLDDDSALGASVGLTYAYSPKTQFTLDLDNDFGTASGGGGTETFHVALGAQTQFTTELSAGASASYESIDYSDNSRKDDFYVFALYGNYVINQYLNLTAAYNYQWNDSNISAADFKANVVSLTLSFRY
ncbi:hypothetical protein OpiT1DRAFT_01646 [Opitutaceae bacterium TAV1]|nr:hypothetical protein OpiT1DRAFT_01646 [Opitutaceae bacterium TAV1]